jgi:hypothetical protein
MEQTNKKQLTIYEREKRRDYFKNYYQLHREKLLEAAKERNARLRNPPKDPKITLKKKLIWNYL